LCCFSLLALILSCMLSNSKYEVAMANSIVKLEVKEERMEAKTVEASFPAQDLELNVEPMDVWEQVRPFPVFRSFLHIPRWGFSHSPPLPYCSSCYQKKRTDAQAGTNQV
jgi:hypothetical protein